MKPTFRSLLAVAGLALAAVLSSAPAHATIQPCTQYVPPPGTPNTGYPAFTGNLYFCFPASRNSNETNAQLLMRNNVAGAFSNITIPIRGNLQSRSINFYVFYNGNDAFDTLQVDTSHGEPPVKSNESGRSWVFLPPNNPTNKATPVTSIFVWTNDQYATLGLNTRSPTTGDIPTAQQTQLSGTARHETGHQIDRVWAQQLNFAPASSSLMVNNYTNYATALGWDGAHLTQADLNTMSAQFPRLVDSSQNLQRGEFFPELIAMFTGGGALPAEDTFITSKFPCARWLVQQGLYSSTGLTPNIGTPKPPTTPAPGACYGHSTW